MPNFIYHFRIIFNKCGCCYTFPLSADAEIEIMRNVPKKKISEEAKFQFDFHLTHNNELLWSHSAGMGWVWYGAIFVEWLHAILMQIQIDGH